MLQVLKDLIARGADPANVRIVAVVAAPPALKLLADDYPGAPRPPAWLPADRSLFLAVAICCLLRAAGRCFALASWRLLWPDCPRPAPGPPAPAPHPPPQRDTTPPPN